MLAAAQAQLEIAKSETLRAGEFYTLLPPADDIHFVQTVSDTPSISIHLLANDTACVWRHRFDPASGRRNAVPFGLRKRVPDRFCAIRTSLSRHVLATAGMSFPLRRALPRGRRPM